MNFSPKTGRPTLLAVNANQRIYIDNYRQFKFGIPPPSSKPIVNCVRCHP